MLKHFRPRREWVATAVILAVGALPGCKARRTASGVEGHFEGSNAQELARLAGKQRVPPQYAPTSNVIVSDKVFGEYGMWDLGKAIVDASARLVVLAGDQQFTVDRFAQAVGSSPEAMSKRVLRVEAATNSVWVRDYAPLAALDERRQVVWVDTNYYPDRPQDDSIPKALEGVTGKRRLSLPVYNEGGNFMTTGNHCFMTERVVQANRPGAMTNRPDEQVLSRGDVERYYKAGVGCPDVTIFPRMPYEGTGHIDMWAKLIGDHQVVVSEMDPFLSNPAPFEADGAGRRPETGLTSAPAEVLDEIRRFLDERSQDFERLGYEVIRLPMPLPVALPPLDGAPEGARAKSSYLFRSYTNALIVNDHIIVPDYVKPDAGANGAAYPDASARDLYRRTVASVYAAAKRTYGGRTLPPLKTVWVRADRAIATGGAVHCVTMQVPAPPP